MQVQGVSVGEPRRNNGVPSTQLLQSQQGALTLVVGTLLGTEPVCE